MLKNTKLAVKKVVTIGGGTGSFTLLNGLKKYPLNISAIVAMADDGGSTGILRDELGVLPPGDVRQCLVALSDSSRILRKLMNYRFSNGCLRGHSFGNIFLSSLEKIAGGFAAGVKEAAEILKIKGEVLPITEDNTRIHIKLNNDKILKGEKELDSNKELREAGVKEIWLRPQAKAYKDTIKKIENADFVIIGPSSYYNSIIANLLVDGIGRAIRKSKAKVIYVCNLTNKKGQTEEFDLDTYVERINNYIGKNRIDYVLFNTKKPPLELIKRYERLEGKDMIVNFFSNKKRRRDYKVIEADILCEDRIKKNRVDLIANTRSFIRHDSDKLARVLIDVMKFRYIARKSIKIFIDFDDVVFNAKKFILDMKKVVLNCGVSSKLYNKYVDDYKSKRDNGELVSYNFEDYINSFREENGVNLRRLKRELHFLIKESNKYVFEDFFDFAKKFDRENLYLLSYGNKFFQGMKIKNSGVVKYFKKTLITDGLKSEKLAKILEEDYNEGAGCYFLDDRAEKLRDVKKRFPEIVTFLVQKVDGRYFDKRDEYCDFVVEGFDEALGIIEKIVKENDKIKI